MSGWRMPPSLPYISIWRQPHWIWGVVGDVGAVDVDRLVVVFLEIARVGVEEALVEAALERAAARYGVMEEAIGGAAVAREATAALARAENRLAVAQKS